MDPVERARDLCLNEDTAFGCAEGTYAALQEHFLGRAATDSTEAMALNGGIAYSGGTCGALSGAALALGRLAGDRVDDRPTAKRVARGLVQHLMTEFEAEYGATDCRSLTGFDLATAHDEFMESGVWENSCLGQIAFVIERLERLADPNSWTGAVLAVTSQVPNAEEHA